MTVSSRDFEQLMKSLESITSRRYNFQAKRQKWNGENFSDEIADQKLNELKWRIRARKRYGAILMALLLIQNFFIGFIVYRAYTQDKIESLALILGTLVVGVFGETAYIIKVIITELFKDIIYQNYDRK